MIITIEQSDVIKFFSGDNVAAGNWDLNLRVNETNYNLDKVPFASVKPIFTNVNQFLKGNIISFSINI